MFIHLGSRKVFVSPSTCCPTGEWMLQQARQVKWWAEDEGIDLRYLIHDRDTKFTEAFDAQFHGPDGHVIKTPFQAPVANAFAESWIGAFKRECLNHFLCFGLKHLDYIVQSFVDYHNTKRPHQSLGNLSLPFQGQPPPAREAEPLGRIRRERILGGLLNHYYRRAA